MQTIRRIFITVLTAFTLSISGAPGAKAQVAQWNQVVTDPKLQRAMYRAIREVAIDYINELDKEGIAGAIAFIDTQLDYPLQLTSSNFRHLNLNALQAKAAYVIRYQARSSADVNVTVALGMLAVGGGGVFGLGYTEVGQLGSGGGEIPGDGAMMLCPINKAGLEVMSGVISLSSIDASGQLRSEQDGKDIVRIHDEILKRTYQYYGHEPDEDDH
ncbi:MAG: hypothetical protein AAF699_13400 [Pseudomonadota bacterium]